MICNYLVRGASSILMFFVISACETTPPGPVSIEQTKEFFLYTDLEGGIWVEDYTGMKFLFDEFVPVTLEDSDVWKYQDPRWNPDYSSTSAVKMGSYQIEDIGTIKMVTENGADFTIWGNVSTELTLKFISRDSIEVVEGFKPTDNWKKMVLHRYYEWEP